MPDLERVQQLTPATLSQQWYEDGAAVDPGTVTLGITRADGTVLVAAGAATTGTATAPRTFNLTTTHTALLERLTVTWTSTTKGTLTSYVEVVGGFLFSIAAARAVPPLNNVTAYPTARLLDMRTLVEQAFEQAANVAFVPRYTLETLSGLGTTTMQLRWPKVTAIRSVTIDGVAVSPTTDVIGLMHGYAYYSPTWATGYANVVIGYEHGHTVPPARISEAALFEAKYRLTRANSPTDDRTITQSFPDGGTTILQQPGRGGMRFFLPESDGAVAEYSLAVGVA